MDNDIDKIWKREEIESPCVNTCVIHKDSGLCIGCYRREDEIFNWSDLSKKERSDIIASLPLRKPLIKGKRRKRRN